LEARLKSVRGELVEPRTDSWISQLPVTLRQAQGERVTCSERPGPSHHAVLDHPDFEQLGPGRAAVPACRGILADLRADADRESYARLAVHARRVSGRVGPQDCAQSLACRAARSPGGCALRWIARAPDPATAYGQPAGTGAGNAWHLVHRRRPLPDDLGRRPDTASRTRLAATAAGRRQYRVSGVSSGGPRHRDHRRDRAASADGMDP